MMDSRPATDGHPPASALTTRNAWLSYALSFLFSLLVALLVPIIPLMAFRMGASQFELGLIGSATPLTYVPLALWSGRLSDRIRRKGLILISALTYALACVAYSVSSAPLHLIGGKLLEGISTAMLWPALEALLADSAQVTGDKLVSNFGVLWSSGSFSGGVLSSIVLGTGQYEVVFLPSAGLALLMCLASALIISEGRRVTTSPGGNKVQSPVTPMQMMPTWAISALYAFCQGTIFSLYPPYAQLRGIPGTLIGLSIAFILAGRTVLFYLYRFIRSGFRTLALVGSLMISVFTLQLAFSTEPLVLLSGGFLLGVGEGLCYSAAIRSALEADPASRGTYAGLFEGSIGLGYLIGPAIGGTAAEFVLAGPYVIASLVALTVSAIVVKGLAR